MAGRTKRNKRKKLDTAAMVVASSGDAHASHGGMAVTGVMHAEQLTVVQHRAPREPATWPHQVGVIPSPAQAFQYRAEARRLRTALDHGGTAVLTGMGGVGKTQLAAAYARTAWQEVGLDVLVWVTASDRSAIVSRYAQAGVELCRADADDPERAAEAFLAWLAPHTGPRPCKWLIVLDDVADPDDLRGLWTPPNPYGRTVVTTRRRDAALITEARPSIEIGTFSQTEAVSYLAESLSQHPSVESAEQLAALASELGYLPLALAQAAAYLIDSGIDIGAYRDLLASRTATLTDTAPARLPDDQATPIAATWSLSIDRAEQISPVGLARPMLYLAAMLDPNGIPHEVLTSGPALFFLSMLRGAERRERARWRSWLPVLRPVAVTPDEAVGALRVLHRLSLIDYPVTATHTSIRVHQLIQRVTRDSLTRRRHDYLVRLTADALLTAWPDIEDDAVLAQAFRANTSALMVISADALYLPRPHGVLYRMGQSLGDAGDAAATTDHYTHIAAAAVAHHGPYHPGTIAAQHNLAMWQGVTGDMAASVAAIEDLLHRALIVQGKHHPNVLTLQHDLAVRRGEAGDAAGAAAALTRIVDMHVRLLGVGHPRTIKAQGNLAHWRGEAGDAAGAVAALSALVQRMAEIQGREHPDTFVARAHLAAWIGKSGDPAKAVDAFEELVDDQVRVYGRNHRNTLSLREDLAVWRGEADDTTGATAALKELHLDRIRILGPEDNDTLSTLAHLAHWQGWSGDVAGAVETLTVLFSTRLRILGADHQATLGAQNALAFWRTELEDPARGDFARESVPN